jgi:glutathione S-transferase
MQVDIRSNKMLTIYGAPTFNATKVVLTAEELGLDYDYVHIDLREGEHKSPEHLLRHPLGKVPAIEYNGKPLFESNSICRFLASSEGSPLYNGDHYQLAVIDQWVDMMSYHTGRWVGVFYFQEFITPRFFKKEANQDALAEAKGFLDEQLPVIDKHLSGNKYFAGDVLTIADTVAFSFFYTHEMSSVDFSEYENISQWYSAIRKSAAFDRTKTCLDEAHGAL